MPLDADSNGWAWGGIPQRQNKTVLGMAYSNREISNIISSLGGDAVFTYGDEEARRYVPRWHHWSRDYHRAQRDAHTAVWPGFLFVGIVEHLWPGCLWSGLGLERTQLASGMRPASSGIVRPLAIR